MSTSLPSEDGEQPPTLATIFVATKKMIDDYHEERPNLLMQDTTFKTNVQRYKLLKCVFVNHKTNKTKVAAFAVILDERMDTYKEVIETCLYCLFHTLK